MDFQFYIDQMKEFQNNLLIFLDDEDSFDQNYQNFKDFLQKQNILIDRLQLYEILHLISKITKNHHRFPNFYQKMQKLFLLLKNHIKQTFSNFEIYHIYKNNNLILLILLENEIITLDETIATNFLIYYFSPEIEPLLDKEMIEMVHDEITKIDRNALKNFKEKRQIGNNSLYICELIRKDSIDEFIILINRTNTSLESTIVHSFFETNEFLIDKNPTLIEYAAFYGSIQIFQYLRLNNVRLNSSLWLYVIHSKNAEIIHLLEEDHVNPPENSYVRCFEEAIKCHHNDIARYIQDNYLQKQSFSPFSYYYYNFELFQNDQISYKYLFMYDYVKLVDILLKMKGNDINKLIDIFIFH